MQINNLALMRVQTLKGPKVQNMWAGRFLFYQDTHCMMLSHGANCKDTKVDLYLEAQYFPMLDTGPVSFRTYYEFRLSTHWVYLASIYSASPKRDDPMALSPPNTEHETIDSPTHLAFTVLPLGPDI